MKTKEELRDLIQEYKALTAKLKELTQEELEEIAGGAIGDWNEITDGPGINVKDVGELAINHGEVLGSNPENEVYIPLPSDEKIKS